MTARADAIGLIADRLVSLTPAHQGQHDNDDQNDPAEQTLQHVGS